jgi:hypothetical protein
LSPAPPHPRTAPSPIDLCRQAITAPPELLIVGGVSLTPLPPLLRDQCSLEPSSVPGRLSHRRPSHLQEHRRPPELSVPDLRRLCPLVVVLLAVASHQGEEVISLSFFLSRST